MTQDQLQAMFTQEELARHIEEANSGGEYERWKQVRQFIVQAIHKDGTFFDIGCANGFLMKSLMHWSRHHLIPYGIDNRDEAIKNAKLLLPEYTENFQCIDGDHLEGLEERGMPLKYDFVYRNYWKRDVDTSEKVRTIVTKLWEHVNDNGRMILGVYWGSNHSKGSEEEKKSRESFLEFINRIKIGAGKSDGEAFSESGFHWIMWINKPRGTNS